MNPIKRIIVGVDFSGATEAIVRATITLASSFRATVDVVHVRQPFAYPMTGGAIPTDAQKEVLFNWIDDALERVCGQFADAGVACITTSLDGSPAARLVAHAEKTAADLIIVGTHGRGGLSHAILGSVANRVVQKAHRPVLVIPAARPGDARADRLASDSGA
jgi:nucleotide-binding universal stress UspA family protein